MKRERLPLILGAAAAALALLLAAIVPALFVREAANEAAAVPLTTGERAALFQLYWAEDEHCAVERFQRSDFAAEALAASDALVQQLRADLRFDKGEPVTDTAGEYFYRLWTQDGRSLRMQEYYEQSSGDWSNWFRVFVDIDTLDVYFLYESSKCLKNKQNYPLDDVPGAWDLAEAWQEYMGYDEFVYLSGEGNSASVAYIDGEQTIYGDVRFTTYSSPEYVVDFCVELKPPVGFGLGVGEAE